MTMFKVTEDWQGKGISKVEWLINPDHVMLANPVTRLVVMADGSRMYLVRESFDELCDAARVREEMR